MWVVKIGGSLLGDALLPQWLELLAQLGGGRVTVVCGGGGLADEVRRLQAHWHFDDLAAHNMALLAMAQTVQLARGLTPTLQLAASESEIRRVLHGGHTAVWQPFELLRAKDPAQPVALIGFLKERGYLHFYEIRRTLLGTRRLSVIARFRNRNHKMVLASKTPLR